MLYCPNFFWNVLQVWMTGKDVYLQMTWSWPDKTWNILCSYCLQWNTSQSKFRNHYFLFLFAFSILSQLFLIWGCTITPSTSVRNLGVIFDDQLRPFLTEHAAQLLVQAHVISRLDYCNALLAGLPSSTIKPLQMIQNAAARLVFNEPKRAHVTPRFISLHWLPVATCIKFKTLMLAYRTTLGSAPAYFQSLLRIYIPSRSLRSACEQRLVVPSQRGSKSLSRTFTFTIPGWWNDLPTPIWNAGSLSILKQQLKTYLFRHYLTSS